MGSQNPHVVGQLGIGILAHNRNYKETRLRCTWKPNSGEGHVPRTEKAVPGYQSREMRQAAASR